MGKCLTPEIKNASRGERRVCVSESRTLQVSCINAFGSPALEKRSADRPKPLNVLVGKESANSLVPRSIRIFADFDSPPKVARCDSQHSDGLRSGIKVLVGAI